jgi:hypothetical protein
VGREGPLPAAEASYFFRDLLTGDGCVLKTYIDGDDVITSRFPAWEFYFDEAESIYGEPECAYHVHYLPLEQAAAKYNVPEAELLAYAVSQPMGIVYVSNRQLVRIVEAWRRGPGEAVQDRRRRGDRRKRATKRARRRRSSPGATSSSAATRSSATKTGGTTASRS